MDDMYPEIYHELNPLVVEAADQIIAAGIELTPDITSWVVDNIIRNSGMWYEDEDEDGSRFDQNLEAIPVQARFGGMPFRRRRRRHHNRNTLRDIIRILLLNELFRKRGRGFSGF